MRTPAAGSATSPTLSPIDAQQSLCREPSTIKPAARVDVDDDTIDTEPDMCFPLTVCGVRLKPYPSLLFHRKLVTIRYVISVFLVVNLLLFLVADMQVVSTVKIALGFDNGRNEAVSDFINKAMTTIPKVDEETQITLAHLITQFSQGGMWALLVALFVSTIIWPIWKLFWSLSVWSLPTHRIGVASAEYAVLLVNAMGKIGLFLVPMAVCLGTALHIVISPTMQVFLPSAISETVQNLEQVSGGIASLLEQVLNPKGNAIEIIKLPLYVGISLEVAPGGYLFVFCVVLSQIISQIIQRAHYFAHKIYHKDTKFTERKVSLIRIQGASLGTLAIFLSTLAFAFEIAGICANVCEMQYGGVVGVLMDETTPGSSYKVLTLSHISSLQWNTMVELLLVVTAGILPMLHCIVMIWQWIAPMTLNRHNDSFHYGALLYSVCLLDVATISVGVCFPNLEKFIQTLILDKCDALQLFLSTSTMKGPLFDGQSECFTLRAKLLDGFWFLVASAIIHLTAYVLTQWASRKAWLSSFTDYEADHWMLNRRNNSYCGVMTVLLWPFFMPICFCPVDLRSTSESEERMSTFDDMLLEAEIEAVMNTPAPPTTPLHRRSLEGPKEGGDGGGVVAGNLARHEV